MISCFKLNNKVMAKIKQRRLQILVHSCIYYEYDTTIVPDSSYDQWSIELVELQKKYPRETKAVKEYYEAFKDFDGSTGFDLPKDEWVKKKASYLVLLHRMNH